MKSVFQKLLSINITDRIVRVATLILVLIGIGALGSVIAVDAIGIGKSGLGFYQWDFIVFGVAIILLAAGMEALRLWKPGLSVWLRVVFASSIVLLLLSIFVFLNELGAIPYPLWIRYSLNHTIVQIGGSGSYGYLGKFRLKELDRGKYPSPARILEDGAPLETPLASRTEIDQLGAGRYWFIDEGVMFSASDNSDPRSNGREYAIQIPPFLLPTPVQWLIYSVTGALWVWYYLMSKARGVPGKDRLVTWIDLVILVCIVVFGVMYQMGRMRGMQPFITLNGDASNITSYAAAYDHPQNFVKDTVLSDRSSYGSYMTIHIPLIRLLVRGYGDYGSAFISLLGLHVIVQLVGFYLLGRVIFRNRYWALLLAVMTSGYFQVVGGEFWGLFQDPLPRFTFQALLPYFLVVAYIWRAKPVVWLGMILMMAGMVYVHPHSAAAWTVALGLGFCVYILYHWRTYRRYVGYLILAGLVVLAIATPFVLNARTTLGVFTPIDESVLLKSIHESVALGDYYYNSPAAFVRTVADLNKTGLLWLGIIGMLGVFYLRRHNPQEVLLVIVWLLGLLFVVVLLPALELQLSLSYHFKPASVGLFRGLRYIYPFTMLFWLWFLGELSNRYQNKTWVVLVALVGFLSVFGTVSHYQKLTDFAHQTLVCWMQGERLCPPVPKYEQAVEALDAVRRLTTTDDSILPLMAGHDDGSLLNALTLRYYALRAVSNIYKDMGTNDLWTKVLQKKDPALRLQVMLDLAKMNKTGYLFVENNVLEGVNPQGSTEIVYQNHYWSLLKIVSDGMTQ